MGGISLILLTLIHIMNVNLLNLQTFELFEKFGIGNHKPGSGSAVALEGMLSAQLIRTVIKLTTERSRKNQFKQNIDSLRKFEQDIDSNIYPALKKLMQLDSDQFDKVVALRTARDQAQEMVLKTQYADEALQALKKATEIPIEIAKLCIKLTEYAVFVFDNGFSAARGDTCVAMNSASSSISGCLSIIDLNLISFENNSWSEKIREQATHIKSSLEKLSLEIQNRQGNLNEEANLTKLFHTDIQALRLRIASKLRLTNIDIENIAASLHLILSKYQKVVLRKDNFENPIGLIKPEIVLKKLGYQFQRFDSLGQNDVQGDLFEIAGIIDQSNKFVVISKKFSPETQIFTSAHELGHALLHKQSILHRDRPVDGLNSKIKRNPIEQQADKFASSFLMPKELVTSWFEKLFLTKKFIINDDVLFALNGGSISEFRQKVGSLRGLSRLLSTLEYFNNTPFTSISKMFSVSSEAMAIRLEELELIEF